jgi:hypothetical protein
MEPEFADHAGTPQNTRRAPADKKPAVRRDTLA